MSLPFQKVIAEGWSLSEIRSVEPVVRMCAVISGSEPAREWALGTIAKRWGPIENQTAPIRFEAGGFYASTMGSDLTKTLVECRQFADPADLDTWKRQTNDWEREYAALGQENVIRPLNLDPGYISQAKLVLATIKDRDHRIYLRNGIFAEVTLNYMGKKWVHHRWSYPSYREPCVADFAMAARKRLREHLIATGQLRTSKPAG